MDAGRHAFAKTKGTAAAVMLVSLGICAPFMILIGIIGMLFMVSLTSRSSCTQSLGSCMVRYDR